MTPKGKRAVRVWLHGLIAAVIGGLSNAITNIAIDPFTFNFSEGLPKLGQAALISAVVGVALYLKKPLPFFDDEEEEESPSPPKIPPHLLP